MTRCGDLALLRADWELTTDDGAVVAWQLRRAGAQAGGWTLALCH